MLRFALLALLLAAPDALAQCSGGSCSPSGSGGAGLFRGRFQRQQWFAAPSAPADTQYVSLPNGMVVPATRQPDGSFDIGDGQKWRLKSERLAGCQGAYCQGPATCLSGGNCNAACTACQTKPPFGPPPPCPVCDAAKMQELEARIAKLEALLKK